MRPAKLRRAGQGLRGAPHANSAWPRLCWGMRCTPMLPKCIACRAWPTSTLRPSAGAPHPSSSSGSGTTAAPGLRAQTVGIAGRPKLRLTLLPPPLPRNDPLAVAEYGRAAEVRLWLHVHVCAHVCVCLCLCVHACACVCVSWQTCHGTRTAVYADYPLRSRHSLRPVPLSTSRAICACFWHTAMPHLWRAGAAAGCAGQREGRHHRR